MSYGISLINGEGSTLIDQNYTNLYIKSSGSVNVPAGPIFGASSITIPGYTAEDMLFVQADRAGIYLVRTGLSIRAAGVAGVVNYRVYAKQQGNISPATSGYGLEVYNGASQVVFSSSYPPPKRANVYYGQRPIVDSVQSTTKNVWASLTHTGWFRMVPTGPNRQYHFQCVECYRSSGTSYYRPLNVIEQQSGSGIEGYNDNFSSMLFIKD